MKVNVKSILASKEQDNQMYQAVEVEMDNVDEDDENSAYVSNFQSKSASLKKSILS
jgi:hypothetical protein